MPRQVRRKRGQGVVSDAAKRAFRAVAPHVKGFAKNVLLPAGVKFAKEKVLPAGINYARKKIREKIPIAAKLGVGPGRFKPAVMPRDFGLRSLRRTQPPPLQVLPMENIRGGSFFKDFARGFAKGFTTVAKPFASAALPVLGAVATKKLMGAGKRPTRLSTRSGMPLAVDTRLMKGGRSVHGAGFLDDLLGAVGSVSKTIAPIAVGAIGKRFLGAGKKRRGRPIALPMGAGLRLPGHGRGLRM